MLGIVFHIEDERRDSGVKRKFHHYFTKFSFRESDRRVCSDRLGEPGGLGRAQMIPLTDESAALCGAAVCTLK